MNQTIAGFVVSAGRSTSVSITGNCRRRLVVFGLLVAILTATVSSHAAIFVWNGAGGSGNWSDVGNWSFSLTAPTNGDTLIFPQAPRLTNTNNIANLTLNQIRFLGSN